MCCVLDVLKSLDLRRFPSRFPSRCSLSQISCPKCWPGLRLGLLDHLNSDDHDAPVAPSEVNADELDDTDNASRVNITGPDDAHSLVTTSHLDDDDDGDDHDQPESHDAFVPLRPSMRASVGACDDEPIAEGASVNDGDGARTDAHYSMSAYWCIRRWCVW